MWRKSIGVVILISCVIILTSAAYTTVDADDVTEPVSNNMLYNEDGITIELIPYEGTVTIYDTDGESHLKNHLLVKMNGETVSGSSYRITGIPGDGAEGERILSVDISSENRLYSCPIALDFIVNEIISVIVNEGEGLTFDSNTEYDALKFTLINLSWTVEF